MKKEKACMSFYTETNLIKGFTLVSRPFWTGTKFFQSRSEAEQLAGSDKRKFFAYQPCSKGTFLSYRGKIYIKKSCNYSAFMTM